MKKLSKISATILAAGALAQGQVYTPPAQPAQPQQTQPIDNAPRQETKPAPSPLGQEIPMLDPSAETITVGGVAIPLGDNRLLKARFEKYLNQPPESTEDAREYRKSIATILATVSPFHEGGPNLGAAFRMLPAAATYPGDAGICSTLAEAVYVAMLAKNDVSNLAKINTAIEEEKQQKIKDNDWAARHETDKAVGNTGTPAAGGGGRGGQGGGNRGGGGGQPAANPTNAGTGANSLKYADTLRRIAEIEALKKANIVRTEAQTIKTKAQYQVNMIQWFVQRRYEHVLMASRFYNQIWKDGDTTLRIDKGSDVAKLFSESVGVSPTVSSLDALSSEVIREVEKYIEAFDMLLEREELHSASQRLMEAYALGEYLAPVATLSLEKKRRVAEYVRDLHELYGTLQAHDYTKAKELADRLKATAKDFPSSKVDSAIAAYTLASDLAVEEAKMHMLARENEKAAEKVRAATEIWPTNPKLNEIRKMIGDLGPIVIARNDFDRLLNEQNYREIFKEQYRLAPAIDGDAVRMDAFKQIIQNITRIETALGKASEFRKMGQAYAAWEQLADLRTEFPDDPKLGRELEELAPSVADFTRALQNAKDFEERVPRQTGSALAWYLKARSIYPRSEMSEDGIKRNLDEVLPDENTPVRASESSTGF
jgi:hypothetical protein